MARACWPALAVAGLAACASATADPDAPREGTGIVVSPYAELEACAPLGEGDRLDYRFTTQDPVAFDIYYREGPSVVMPVTRERTRGEADIYRALIPQTYCLHWVGGAVGTLLEYRMQVLREPR